MERGSSITKLRGRTAMRKKRAKRKHGKGGAISGDRGGNGYPLKNYKEKRGLGTVFSLSRGFIKKKYIEGPYGHKSTELLTGIMNRVAGQGSILSFDERPGGSALNKAKKCLKRETNRN